ncbi:MAG: hypothetical protein ACFBSF_09160 [Leptolyngbyaceae cyanobacterium]
MSRNQGCSVSWQLDAGSIRLAERSRLQNQSAEAKNLPAFGINTGLMTREDII